MYINTSISKIVAADRKRINAFWMDMYRRMLRISWREHRTNNSILEELEPVYSIVGYCIPLNRLYPGLNRPRLGYTPGYIMA